MAPPIQTTLALRIWVMERGKSKFGQIGEHLAVLMEVGQEWPRLLKVRFWNKILPLSILMKSAGCQGRGKSNCTPSKQLSPRPRNVKKETLRQRKKNKPKSLSQTPAIYNPHSEHHQRQGDSSRDRLGLVDCLTVFFILICKSKRHSSRPVVLLGPTWRLMGVKPYSNETRSIMMIVQSYHNRQLLENNISLTKVLWSSEHPVNKLIIQLISSSKKKSTLPLGQIQKYKNTNTNTMDKGDNLKPANSLHMVHWEWEALSCINVSETYVGLTIYQIRNFLFYPWNICLADMGLRKFLFYPYSYMASD